MNLYSLPRGKAVLNYLLETGAKNYTHGDHVNIPFLFQNPTLNEAEQKRPKGLQKGHRIAFDS